MRRKDWECERAMFSNEGSMDMDTHTSHTFLIKNFTEVILKRINGNIYLKATLTIN